MYFKKFTERLGPGVCFTVKKALSAQVKRRLPVQGRSHSRALGLHRSAHERAGDVARIHSREIVGALIER